MDQAITLECRAHEKGTRGQKFVPHKTSCKAGTVYTNLWAASPWSGVDLSFVSKNQKFWATLYPTQKVFFEHFAQGFRICTGIMTQQDRAYSLELVHEMLD